MLAMLFSKTFSKLRERLTESDCAKGGGGGCRVRNVKVHCFIEENGEKLFGRADAKLSNSLLVEKIRWVFEKCKKQRAEAGDADAAAWLRLHRIYIYSKFENSRWGGSEIVESWSHRWPCMCFVCSVVSAEVSRLNVSYNIHGKSAMWKPKTRNSHGVTSPNRSRLDTTLTAVARRSEPSTDQIRSDQFR